MCGIVGAIAQRDVLPILLEGLKRLEYRGYDSAGVTLLNAENKLEAIRCAGKVNTLVQACQQAHISGTIGLAHTRWATHGAPTKNNAHPHIAGDKLALVHNGIIENHQALKTDLQSLGHTFLSQTDSESLLHLVAEHYRQEKDLFRAVQCAVQKVKGAFGAAFMHADEPDTLVVTRSGSPLVIGCGLGEYFIASDQYALMSVTHRFIFLEEGDIAKVNRKQVTITDKQGDVITRPIQTLETSFDAGDKGGYRHYMLKEIYEQPAAVSRVLTSRLDGYQVQPNVFGQGSDEVFQRLEHVQIVACGTSYYAGMLAKYWLEDLLQIPCSVEIASEFRYRHPAHHKQSLFMTISQSGETADTLAALALAKTQSYLGFLTLCNVDGSSLVRNSDFTLLLRAGVEVGVASTKALTTQMTALLLFVLALGQAQHKFTQGLQEKICSALRSLPTHLDLVLQKTNEIQKLAQQFSEKQHCLFLGRGTYYPIAMEGALKLKELSYIHAEAYASGELKHGPLALVDGDLPVVVIAPKDHLFDKLKSNIQEVQARGGLLYLFAEEGTAFESKPGVEIVHLPRIESLIAPIVYTVPLQLFAYHVALIKGTDVDQPRNLAKSVTVE